jgi:hypothetical protein
MSRRYSLSQLLALPPVELIETMQKPDVCTVQAATAEAICKASASHQESPRGDQIEGAPAKCDAQNLAATPKKKSP